MAEKKRKRNVNRLVKTPTTPSPVKSDGRKWEDKRMFITTADEFAKEQLIKNGFIYFTKSNGRYYFSYDERKIFNCAIFSKLRDIEYTDILTF